MYIKPGAHEPTKGGHICSCIHMCTCINVLQYVGDVCIYLCTKGVYLQSILVAMRI